MSSNQSKKDTIVILDYGSQFSMLIARRVREAGVYSELVPWDVAPDTLSNLNIKGFILSGGPASVYGSDAPTLPSFVIDSELPILGICYGMQLIAQHYGAEVASASAREYGPAVIQQTNNSHAIFSNLPTVMEVWASHGDNVLELPDGFTLLAESENAPIVAIADSNNHIGIQFHPEVVHTPAGTQLIENFLFRVADCDGKWDSSSFINETVAAIRTQVGQGLVICGLSGGVDSAVAAGLVHRAIGDQLTCIFVDNGLLRHTEAEQVVETFREHMGMKLIHVDARSDFLTDLKGVSDPETKRIRIGEKFIRIFEKETENLGDVDFLVQGTLYPDVIESAASGNSAAVKIKTHHNVGGLPEDMTLTLIEPLRNLFKDEARNVGRTLGISSEIIDRQPFPGPGLAIRIIGEVSESRLDILRRADWILQEELLRTGEINNLWQAFAVLTNTKTVGVQGDYRTYGEVVAIRCITAEDAMTADWAKLPYEVLATVSTRITNEVEEVNRVVYDITSKPPGTIEWE